MRRGLIACAACALAAYGLVVQIRLDGAVPGLGAALPFGVGVLAGLGAAFFTARDQGAALLRRPWCAWGAAIILLAALIVFGRRYRGGLYLPGRLNPAEFVKLAVVVWLAGLAQQEERRPWVTLAGMAVLTGLVAICRDFGLLLQLALVSASLLLVTAPIRGVLFLLVMGVGAYVLAQVPTDAPWLPAHFATRLSIWRDPYLDPQGAGWQTLQGLTALVSGGWTGAGFGLGDVQSIPIVSSDFVYSALAADGGVVGCMLVLGMFAVLACAGLTESPLAVGLVAVLVVQVFLNVAGVLNAMPMTGIPLPFISHGGTSFISMCILSGILWALARKQSVD